MYFSIADDVFSDLGIFATTFNNENWNLQLKNSNLSFS